LHALSHSEVCGRKRERLVRAFGPKRVKQDRRVVEECGWRCGESEKYTFIVEDTPSEVKTVDCVFRGVPASIELCREMAFCPLQLSKINFASTLYESGTPQNAVCLNCHRDDHDIWFMCYDCRTTICEWCEGDRQVPVECKDHLHHVHDPDHARCDWCGWEPITDGEYWTDREGDADMCLDCSRRWPGDVTRLALTRKQNKLPCVCCPFGSVRDWQRIAKDAGDNLLLLNVNPESELYDFVAVVRREPKGWSVEVLWHVTLQEVQARAAELLVPLSLTRCFSVGASTTEHQAGEQSEASTKPYNHENPCS
jgi:hypothetical protein